MNKTENRQRKLIKSEAVSLKRSINFHLQWWRKKENTNHPNHEWMYHYRSYRH